MSLLAYLLITVGVCCCCVQASESSDTKASPFTIAAFNIQIFGKAKMAKPDVVDVLVKTLRRYDIVSIEEIRDNSGTYINDLLDAVNQPGSPTYAMMISERLGRTSSKEQYAFFYRVGSGISVVDHYQYQDPGDKFQREPYSVLFRSDHTAIHDFVLSVIHTAPDESVEEINALDAVHKALLDHWDNDNILMMGDFNADCNYVSTRAYDKLVLVKDHQYHWLVPSDWDTTVKSTDCAYDRFVMTGDTFVNSVIPNSAQVFHFDEEYGLTETLAQEVSDHYPIQLSLKSASDSHPDCSGDPSQQPDSCSLN